MTDRGDPVRDRLLRWRGELIDPTERNRLLNFKHLRSGSMQFEQTAPELLEGFGRQGQRAGWGFRIPPGASGASHLQTPRSDSPSPDNLIVTAPSRLAADSRQIDLSLETLARTARAEFLETGQWVLHLGLGTLIWRDGDQKLSSPLYLYPVRLERRSGDKPRHKPQHHGRVTYPTRIEPRRGANAWRLLANWDAEPAINHSLALRLEQDYGISLPTLHQLEDNSYSTLKEAVFYVLGATSWEIDDTAILSTFGFQKEVINKDLRDNEDTVVSHPIVRLLAEGPSSPARQAMQFEPVHEARLDEFAHHLEEQACVMEADSSQRQCIVAARQGRSFVIDGPPGTGKSQTIANMIAQLLHDAKTVLFVSEKAAALDVVRDRLASVGLEPFILELHSHKATSKAVAHALAESLATEPRAESRLSESERARLLQKREQLSGYASAANEVREPSRLTLGDVLAEISRLCEHRHVDVPDLDAAGLGADAIAEIEHHALRLSRAWEPVERGDQFLWRDLSDTSTSNTAETEYADRLRRLRTAMLDLKESSEAVHDVLKIDAKPSLATYEWLQRLLELVENRPQIAQGWITAPDLEEVRDLVERLVCEAGRLSEKEQDLAAAVPAWSDLDPFALERLERLQTRLEKIDPRATSITGLFSMNLSARRDAVRHAADAINTVTEAAEPLMRAFGVCTDISLTALDRLVRIGILAHSDTPPEPAWFHEGWLKAARTAYNELAGFLMSFNLRYDDLMRVFMPAALELDLAGLRDRLTYLHRGSGKLQRAYKSDKATLAAHSVSGKYSKEAAARLGELLSLQMEARKLKELEARHSRILGAYYPNRHANMMDCRDALKVAERALTMAGGTIAGPVMAAALGRAQPARPHVAVAAQRAAEALAAFNNTRLAAGLGRAGLRQAAEHYRGLLAVMDEMTEEMAAIEAKIGYPITFTGALDLLRARADHHRLAAEVSELADSARHIIGDSADAPDAETLRAASEWVDLIRSHLGGKVEAPTAKSILTSSLSASHVSEPRKEVSHRLALLLEAFEAPYREELRENLGDSYDSAFWLLDALADRVTEIHLWSEHVEACAALTAAGLEPALAECRQSRIPSADVPRVLRLSLLRRWAAQITQADPRLLIAPAAEHDAEHAARAAEADTKHDTEQTEHDTRAAAHAAQTEHDARADEQAEHDAHAAGHDTEQAAHDAQTEHAAQTEHDARAAEADTEHDTEQTEHDTRAAEQAEHDAHDAHAAGHDAEQAEHDARAAEAEAAHDAGQAGHDARAAEHAAHDAVLRELHTLNRKLLEDAAAAVITSCVERRPPAALSGVDLIRAQADLESGHMRCADMLSMAAEAALRLKPCFMMSPLSVSQFLPPDLKFDAVIMDEASQLKAHDVIGSVYRGTQLIVAGDRKQLPPTSPFDRRVGRDQDDIDEPALEFDSVLDLCHDNLVSLPLNWHYRSRDESLIAYSNHSFYDNRLQTQTSAAYSRVNDDARPPDAQPPPPSEASPVGLGIELRRVKGVYRRGKARDNPVEAVEVVDRVLFHRQNHPDLTLGVVALSAAQQSAVEAELERRSRTEPELRELVREDRLSGFFVKIPQTAQGDERDVIVLTIGYGPNEHGKVSMNFGPLHKEGDERRLNVAVTRARRRLEVVTSISGSDITSQHAAMRHLQSFLNYAEEVPGAMAADPADSDP